MTVLAPFLLWIMTYAAADAAYNISVDTHPDWEMRAELTALVAAAFMMLAMAAILAPHTSPLPPMNYPPSPFSPPWPYL